MFSLPESLRLYHRILVEEFMREWRFLMDALAGRAQGRADFTDKLVNHFKNLVSLGVNQLPLPATSVLAAGSGVLIDWANGKRKEDNQKHFGKQQWEVDEIQLRIFIEAAALEACRRYQYVILAQLSQDPLKGVVPLAKAGVERMLEYLGRNKLPVTVDNLVDGLLAGHSGAYVTGYTNTQLMPHALKKPDGLIRKARRKLGNTGYTAEGVYGRSGLMTRKGELYALADKTQARHKMQQIKGCKEALFNYGYTHLLDKTQDPKYGYLYVSERVVDQLYGHLKGFSVFQNLKQNKDKLTPGLQQQLKSFKPAIIAIDKKDLVDYLAATKEIVEAKTPDDHIKTQKSLVAFVRRTKPDANAVQFVLYDPEDPKDHDLTDLNFAGLNLDDCGFMHCQFGQSLKATTFRRSALQFADLTKVTTAEEADFSEAHCEYIEANKLNLTKAKLNQTNCSYSDFSEATLVQSQTSGTVWHQTNLTDIHTENATEKQVIEMAQLQQQKIVTEQQKQLQQLEQQLQLQQAELHILQAQIDQLMKRPEQNESIAELIEMMQVLHQEQQSHLTFERSTKTQLIHLQTTQALHEKTLAHHSDQIQQLQAQIKTFEIQHTEFGRLVKETLELANTVLQHQERIQDLDKKTKVLSDHYQKIIEHQLQQAQQITKLERRASILQQDVTEIQQQIRYLVITDEKLDQLKIQAQQTLKQRYLGSNEIRGLFGKPFQLEGQYINLQMLYKIDLKEEKKEEKDEKKSDDKNKKLQDKRISSFEDLFGDKRTIKPQDLFKPDKELFSSERIKDQKQADKPPNFLLIQGRAGIGKTTFVRFAVREWAKPKDGLYAQYEWVFTLILRELRSPFFKELVTQRKQLPFWLWIYYSQFKTSGLSEQDFGLIWQRRIEPTLKNNKLLLILDGLDEIPDLHPCEEALKALLEGEYAHVAKIITSRPYGVTHLPQARRDIEIIGFTDENIECYIKTYFSDKKEEFIFKFIKNLKDQPTLWGCAHIPVNLNLLCGIADGAAKQSHHVLERELEQLYSMTSTYEAMECKLYERTYTERPNADHRLPSLLALRKQFLFKHYQLERRFLAKLAFLGMQEQQIILPRKHINQLLLELFTEARTMDDVAFMQSVRDLGLVKPVVETSYIPEEEQSYEFIHLTFQEYYTAVYVAENLLSQNNNQRTITEAVIAQEKLNPRWQIVWWFVAGLLKEEPKPFANFINLLSGYIPNSNPIVHVPIVGDLLHHYELGLLVRCVEEGYSEKNKATIASLRERVQSFMAHAYQLSKQNLLPKNFQPFLFASLRLSPRFCQAVDELDIYAKISETDKRELLYFIGRTSVNSPKTISIRLLRDQEEQKNSEEIAFLKRIDAKTVNDKIFDHLALLLTHDDSEIQDATIEAIKILGLVAAKPVIIKKLAVLLKSDQANSWSVINLFEILLIFGKLALTSDMIEAFSSWLIDANGWTDEMMLWISNVKDALATPIVLEQLGSVLLKRGGIKEQPDVQIKIANLIAAAAITTTLLESLTGDSPEKNNKFLCYLAIKGLIREAAYVATSAVLQHLAKLLLSSNRKTVLNAIKTVAFMGPVAAIPIICQRLAMIMGGMDEELRVVACETAMILGPAILIPEFLKPLIGLLVDEHEDIQKIAGAIVVYFTSLMPDFLERSIVFAKDALQELDIYLILLTEIKERSEGYDNSLPYYYILLDIELPGFRAPSWILDYCCITPVSVEKIRSALAKPALLKRYEVLLADIDDGVRLAVLDVVNVIEPDFITSTILDRLASIVTDKDYTIAERALIQVARIGAAAITRTCKYIIALLANEDTREAGIRGAQLLGSSRGVELGIKDIPTDFTECLRGLLADKQWQCRKAAAQIISSLHDTAITTKVVDGLVKLLVDEKEEVQAQALDVMASISPRLLPQTTIEYLKRLFPVKNQEIRIKAVLVAGNFGPQAATAIPAIANELLTALETKDAETNEKLITSIGKLGPAVATPLVLGRIQVLLRDGNLKVQKAAVIAMGKLAPEAVKESIFDEILHLYIQHSGAHTTWLDEEQGFIKAARETLIIMARTLFIFDHLVSLITSDKLSRDLMVPIMKGIGHSPVPSPFTAHLQALLIDKNEKLREVAAYVIEGIGSSAAEVFLEPLVTLLEDKDENVFLAAVAALKSFGAKAITQKSLARFIALMRNKSSQRCLAILEIIGNMDPNSISSDVLNGFETLLREADTAVCSVLLETIEKLGISAITPFIFERLVILALDQDWHLCSKAENILKKISLIEPINPLFIECLNRLLSDQSPDSCKAAVNAINLCGFIVVTPLIYKKLVILRRTEKIKYFPPQKATLAFLAATYDLLTDKNKEVQREAITFLNEIIKQVYTQLLHEWLEQTHTSAAITSTLPALYSLFLGAYLCGNINCCILWNESARSYFIQGFADSIPYQFPINPHQAQALRHLLPTIVEQFNSEEFVNVEAIAKQMQQWPQMGEDPLLADSRVSTLKPLLLDERATKRASISSSSYASFFSSSSSVSSTVSSTSTQQTPSDNMSVSSSAPTWESVFADLKTNDQFKLLFQLQTLLVVEQNPQNFKEVTIQLVNKTATTIANQLKLLGNKLEEHCSELKEKDFRKGVLALRFKNSSDADEFLEFIQSPASGLHWPSQSATEKLEQKDEPTKAGATISPG